MYYLFLGVISYGSSFPNAVPNPLDKINININLGKGNNGEDYYESGIEGKSEDYNTNGNGNDNVYGYNDYKNKRKYGKYDSREKKCGQLSCEDLSNMVNGNCYEFPTWATIGSYEKVCNCEGATCPICCRHGCKNGLWYCVEGSRCDQGKCPGDDCIGTCNISYPSNWTGPIESPTIKKCPVLCSYCSAGGVMPQPNTVVRSRCYILPPP